MIKREFIPLQFSSVEEAQIFENIGDSISTSATFISGSNALMSLPLKASLNKLWSMLNSQQIVVQLPLMEGTKYPANASMMNEVFLGISNFEIIPSEMINDKLFYLPEVDPYNLNFL